MIEQPRTRRTPNGIDDPFTTSVRRPSLTLGTHSITGTVLVSHRS